MRTAAIIDGTEKDSYLEEEEDDEEPPPKHEEGDAVKHIVSISMSPCGSPAATKETTAQDKRARAKKNPRPRP